jgi:choline-sulfatase
MKRGCTPPSDNATAYAAFFDPLRIAHVRRIYLAQLEELDAMVGTIVATLKAAGRWDADTLLILSADHGDMQLEKMLFYKMVAYDASSRVPLVIASPRYTGGRVITQPTQLLDIFPTVLAAAGLPIPAEADGYDLAPFLNGAATDPSRPGFVCVQNHDEDISASWFAVTDGAYKLVQYGDGGQVVPQLFNLSADAGEDINLAVNASPAITALIARLDGQLRTVMDYLSIAADVADYQRRQFAYWQSQQTDWEKEIASQNVRWTNAWSQDPAGSLAAVKAWMANSTIWLQSCSGALVQK